MASQKKKPPLNYGEVADKYGELKARMSELNEELDVLKKILIDSNQYLIRGSMFQVSITTQERVTLNAEKVREILTPKQLDKVSQFTMCTVVRCTAKT